MNFERSEKSNFPLPLPALVIPNPPSAGEGPCIFSSCYLLRSPQPAVSSRRDDWSVAPDFNPGVTTQPDPGRSVGTLEYRPLIFMTMMSDLQCK